MPSALKGSSQKIFCVFRFNFFEFFFNFFEFFKHEGDPYDFFPALNQNLGERDYPKSPRYHKTIDTTFMGAPPQKNFTPT